MLEWVMKLLGMRHSERREHHKGRLNALQELEDTEKQAVSRLVSAGVQAAIEADKAAQTADKISDDLGNRDEGRQVIQTAQAALRFLEGRGERKR